MITEIEKPPATARGVRGAVAGGQGETIRWEAKPGALLPPGRRRDTHLQLHGSLDDVIAAMELLVSENRSREIGK